MKINLDGLQSINNTLHSQDVQNKSVALVTMLFSVGPLVNYLSICTECRKRSLFPKAGAHVVYFTLDQFFGPSLRDCNQVQVHVPLVWALGICTATES